MEFILLVKFNNLFVQLDKPGSDNSTNILFNFIESEQLTINF